LTDVLLMTTARDTMCRLAPTPVVVLCAQGCAIAAQLSGGLANMAEMQHMKQNIRSPLGLSTSQAAQALGVSLGTIRRWSDMGYLQSYRTPGGQRRFSQEQIDQFVGSLEQQTTQPVAERKAG
jgi:excisionase family DNA binding protein